MDYRTIDGKVYIDGQLLTVNEAKEYLQEQGFSYFEANDYIRSLPIKKDGE